MMQQYRSNSYLFGGNAPYVEEMYEAYLDNPGSVPDNWRDYFDALHKRIYRQSQQTLDKLVKKLINKVDYINSSININGLKDDQNH